MFGEMADPNFFSCFISRAGLNEECQTRSKKFRLNRYHPRTVCKGRGLNLQRSLWGSSRPEKLDRKRFRKLYREPTRRTLCEPYKRAGEARRANMLWSLFSSASLRCDLCFVLGNLSNSAQFSGREEAKEVQRALRVIFVQSSFVLLFKYILHGGVAQPEFIPPTLRCAVR